MSVMFSSRIAASLILLCVLGLPAVLHLHGSGDTARDNIEVLRIFARSGYVAMLEFFDTKVRW